MRAKLLRVLNWAAGRVPTLVVWAGLVGLFVYGSARGWKFGDAAETDEQNEAADDAPADEPGDREPPDPNFQPRFEDRPFDVPVYVDHDPRGCRNLRRVVRFKSPEAEGKAGIVAQGVGTGTVRVAVTAPGGAVQKADAVGEVVAPAPGVVVAVLAEFGKPVKKGDPVLVLESPQVGEVKAGLRAARLNLRSARATLAAAEERVRILANSTPTAEQTRLAAAELDQAKVGVDRALAGLDAARQAILTLRLPLPPDDDEARPDAEYADRLLFLGVPEKLRQTLYAPGRPPSANMLPLSSPVDGVVMRPPPALLNRPVQANQPLLEVGDPARVDVFLSVRLEDLPRVAVGQKVTFRPEGAAGGPVPGTVWLLDPRGVDPATRTQRAWVAVDNKDGRVRAGAFGAGEITVVPPREVLVVPRAAVHWEGCSHVVFVREVVKNKQGEDEARYRPRRVTLGVPDGDRVEVVDGLKAGEPIAVVGSHVLKNELLKDRIGAAEE